MARNSIERPSDKGAFAGVAEEFAAAIEASTGKEVRLCSHEPADGKAIVDYMDRLLLAPRPDRGLDVLERTGVLKHVFPELEQLVDFGEGVRHKDVWDHTKKVVLQAPSRRVVRWTALFHDIGKVPTRRFDEKGLVSFLGHPEVGARMFERIARRLSLDTDLRDRVSLLIAYHLRAAAYEPKWTDSAVRRFIRDLGDSLEDLLDLSRADITSKYEVKVQRGIRQINLLAERVEIVREIDSRPRPLPKGLGDAIMERFSLVPGPHLGEVMRTLKRAVESGELDPRADYSHYLDFINDNNLLAGFVSIGEFDEKGRSI